MDPKREINYRNFAATLKAMKDSGASEAQALLEVYDSIIANGDSYEMISAAMQETIEWATLLKNATDKLLKPQQRAKPPTL
jgi:hypothetical protein